MKTLGDYMDGGVFKSCYTIKEQDDRVALIRGGAEFRKTATQEDKQILLEEKALLDRLIQNGLPALVTKISLLKNPRIDGGQIWALTCPKYDWHSKRWDHNKMTGEQFRTLSKMAETMDEKKISIHDPQFLFRANSGDVVISDPLGVAIGEEENRLPYWARRYGGGLRPVMNRYEPEQKRVA